jgi:hypothetical protein
VALLTPVLKTLVRLLTRIMFGGFARQCRVERRGVAPTYRLPPSLAEDDTPAFRSNRLLDAFHRIKYEYISELLQRRADLRLIKIQRKVEFVTDSGLILRNTV